jgi:hypothetical protein
LAAAASAQTTQKSKYGLDPGQVPVFELGLSYQTTLANAPPKVCGCFWFQGGGTQFVFTLHPHWSGVADLSGGNKENVNGYGERLSFFNYVFGPRYTLRTHHGLSYYAQGLGGRSEVFSNYPLYGQGTSHAAAMGGLGVNLRVSRYLSVTPVEADYVYTRQQNGVNTHQNNLRLGAGITFRVGER